MNQIILGKTGIKVSAIGLGTWAHGGANVSEGRPVGWAGQEDVDSYKALIRSWEIGINHWDTADVYGDGRAEIIIGFVWDTIPRQNVFLASKVGWSRFHQDHFYHPADMRDRLERSLKNLKTDIIDIYYFHHCFFGKVGEYLDGALEVMHRFKEEGKIRFIGLSDWDLTKVRFFADKVKPDVVQVYRSVLDDHYESSGLKKWVEENQVGTVFFSPLKHGLLTGKYTEPPNFPPGDFRVNVKEFKNRTLIEKFQQNRDLLGERFKDHPEPILHGLVDFLLTDAPNTCVLLGMRNRLQVESAKHLGNPLSQSDAKWIKKLYKR